MARTPTGPVHPTLLRREIRAAGARIAPHVLNTPVERSTALSEHCRADVYCKHEQSQLTGSFKVRGAINRILALTPAERRRGVVAASSGNHGLAVAAALRRLGISGTIVLPVNAAGSKVAALRDYGVTLCRHGDDCLQSESFARGLATRSGRVFVSPYNDPLVVAGQGTIGIELRSQLPRLDAVFIAVGGGGLIAGVAAELRRCRRPLTVIGCQPRQSAVMHASIVAGRILDLPSGETLADGTAGGVEANAITFGLCSRLVDEWVEVTEEEIAAGVRLMAADQRVIVEGAAGVAVAACMRLGRRLRGLTVAVVLCGRNVSLEVLRSILR